MSTILNILFDRAEIDLKENLAELERAPTVLVIDDQIAAFGAILDYLVDCGLDILVAQDGERGLERARYTRPDLILLDVRMPGIDGFETCRRLKMDDRTRQIPVIFMTSLTEMKDKLTGFAAGGVDYITKPLQMEEVLVRLKTHLTLYRLQQQLEAQNAQLQQEVAQRRRTEESLRQAQVGLEQRVEVRTHELRQANEQLTLEIEERKRAEAALRQSEERYRNLVESAPDVIYTLSTESTITSLNPAFETITGWSRAEWQGRPFSPLLHPDDLPLIQIVHDQLMQSKTPPIFELRILTREGSYIVGEFTTTPLLHDETVVGVLGIARNITRRKRAEEKIQRRNRELALLNQVIAASVTETEAEAILEIACRELAATFDVPQAAATLLNAEKTEAVVVAEYLEGDRPTAMDQSIPVEDNSSFQYLLNHKTPLVVDDAQNDPRLVTIRSFVQQRGIVSLLLVPLIIKGEVVGSLELDAVEPRRFSTEEVGLAWSAADQVSGVLARLRLDQERQRLETQYHQSQKMEALGQLTGGVAHDFNNILTVILGNCGFIGSGLDQDHPLQQEVGQIQKAAERASSLTRQLLTFSRQQNLQPTLLNLNDTVTHIEKMLRRLIGENIDLVTKLEPQLKAVKADPGQLEQVIVNLVVNARDAMPTGGKITIETANIHLDDNHTFPLCETSVGSCVMLAVTDTGHGMDKSIQNHIFEPFFTTKAPGQGTGLGLATVYGIVKQSGGNIAVYSEPGLGATFKVYLPTGKTTFKSQAAPTFHIVDRGGSETILLAEDEEAVRRLVRLELQDKGYTVLETDSGSEALSLARQHEGQINLLITDVVMPSMNGRELARQIKQLYPQIKVLFMSGYTDDAVARHGVLTTQVEFLSKPFSQKELTRRVRQILDK